MGRLTDRILARGHGEGPLLVLDEPISLWGGLEPASGRIVEPGHPQHGRVVTGRVLVMASGRGSSSSSSVLAEAIRLGTAPAAIVLREPDAILALGSIVAHELYGSSPPIVVWTGDLPAPGRSRVSAEDDLTVETI